MSQILLVFHEGQPLFRRAGHLSLCQGDQVTLFGVDGALVEMSVETIWIVLGDVSSVELAELDWVDNPKPPERRAVLSIAGFVPATMSSMTQQEMIVIDRLLRQLRSSGDCVEVVADDGNQCG